MRNKKRVQGFTLIEVALILVLMGLTVLISSLNYQSAPSLVYGAFLKVKADIRQAQNMALTRGGTFGFKTMSNTSYEIYQNAPGTRPIDPVTAQSFVVDLSKDFPNVQFQGNYQIEFSTGGELTAGGGATYTLGYAGQSTVNRSFSVETVTGFLK